MMVKETKKIIALIWLIYWIYWIYFAIVDKTEEIVISEKNPNWETNQDFLNIQKKKSFFTLKRC